MDEPLPEVMQTFAKDELLRSRDKLEVLPPVKYKNVLSEEFIAKLADIEIEPWYQQANCKNRQEIMYNHLGEKKAAKLRREALAKEICRNCPIIRECLDRAIEGDERGAIWGGLNDEERRTVKKSRKAS